MTSEQAGPRFLLLLWHLYKDIGMYKDLKEKSKSEFKNDHGTDTRSFFSHTSATGVCSLLILHTEKQNTQAATTYKIFPYSMAYVIIVAQIKT